MTSDLEYFKQLLDTCDYTELEFNDGSKQLELINKLIISFDKDENFEKMMTYKLIDSITNFDGVGYYPGIQDVERRENDN